MNAGATTKRTPGPSTFDERRRLTSSWASVRSGILLGREPFQMNLVRIEYCVA
jgi:hypothetical protein